MVHNTSDTPEGTEPQQLWARDQDYPPVQDEEDLNPPPYNPASLYTFVSGIHEAITFAWPNAGDQNLAREMIRVPEQVPYKWKANFIGPPCSCLGCGETGIAEK